MDHNDEDTISGPVTMEASGRLPGDGAVCTASRSVRQVSRAVRVSGASVSPLPHPDL